MLRFATIVTAVLMLASMLAGRAQGPSVLRHSFLGKTPPEIVAEKSHWLGSAQPTTLAELKGKVVWLQFNF